MELVVQSEKLNGGVSKILTVIDKKISRPILTYCMISTDGDKHLELSATDLEVSAKIRIEANIKRQGKFCIQAKNFADILREMPDDEISLSLDENFSILNLYCREIKFSLLICKADEYPLLNISTDLNKFTISSHHIQNLINKTYHALPVDDTRPFLNGIFFHKTESSLRAVSTDGHRLALVDVNDIDVDNEILLDGIIVPKKGINELKKLSDSFSQESIEFSVDDSFIYARVVGHYSLSIRLISREFPKYQAVIPIKTVNKILIDRNLFLTAVKRIKLLASEKSNGIKLIFSKNQLVLLANHPSLGGASEKLVVNYDNKETELGLNAKYLIDTLSILNDQEISFEFNNELSPILIRSPNIQDFVGIIMPLKL